MEKEMSVSPFGNTGIGWSPRKWPELGEYGSRIAHLRNLNRSKEPPFHMQDSKKNFWTLSIYCGLGKDDDTNNYDRENSQVPSSIF